VKVKGWWRAAVPILGAVAGAVLGLAAAHWPKGYWQDSHGNFKHVGLIVASAVIGGISAILVNGVTFVSTYRARNEIYRRSVNETLALVVGDVDEDFHGIYVQSVVQHVQGLSAGGNVSAALTEIQSMRVVPVGLLAAYFHEVITPRFRQPSLRRAERFSAGQDRREIDKPDWAQGDGLIGETWARKAFMGGLIGGPDDPWSPELPQRAAVAYPVLKSGGIVVGVLSVTGPPDALPGLSRCEATLETYTNTLAKIMENYER